MSPVLPRTCQEQLPLLPENKQSNNVSLFKSAAEEVETKIIPHIADDMCQKSTAIVQLTHIQTWKLKPSLNIYQGHQNKHQCVTLNGGCHHEEFQRSHLFQTAIRFFR